MAAPIKKKQSALPPTDTFAELYAASQATQGATNEYLKRLNSSYKTPIQIETEDIPQYCRSLFEACGGGKHTPDSLMNAAAAFVEKGFGTHTTKFPNTNIVLGDEPAFMAHRLPPASCGAVSSSTVLARKYSCAGNATEIAAQRLLTAICVLDGEVTRLADDFTARGPLFREICTMSETSAGVAENLAVKIQNRLDRPSAPLSANNTDRRYGGVTTIYWPTDDAATAFHLVSPITSVPMLSEIRTRTVRDDLRLPRATVLVGGTQPQNAGLLAMDHGGFVGYLSCLPPVGVLKKRADLYHWFVALNNLIGNDGLLVRNNISVREKMNNLVSAIIDGIIDDMLEPPFGAPTQPTVENVMGSVKFGVTRVKKMVLGSDLESLFIDQTRESLADLEGAV